MFEVNYRDEKRTFKVLDKRTPLSNKNMKQTDGFPFYCPVIVQFYEGRPL